MKIMFPHFAKIGRRFYGEVECLTYVFRLEPLSEPNPPFIAYKLLTGTTFVPIESGSLALRPEAPVDRRDYETKRLHEAVWRCSERSIIWRNEAVPLDLGWPSEFENDNAWAAMLAAQADDVAVLQKSGLDPEAALDDDWVHDLRLDRPAGRRPFVTWKPDASR
ncbi:hypothetical protein NKI88_03175 [Mesorhizobium sp. M0317]|uniref:hypothetical protein n=1 Tax=Mesorhizobium sp. M0317 TaxID=2956935 RepID=UPI0033358DEA